MNKYTRSYRKNLETFPLNKVYNGWVGTPQEYIKELDNYKIYITKAVDEFTTAHKATEIFIQTGYNSRNIVVIMTGVGEMTEEEKLKKDKEDKAFQDLLDNAEKEKLKELMKKYPEVVKENT